MLAKNPKMATPMPIFGQNSISRTEGLRELILVPKCSDSVENPVKELFLTCTVVTQFEKTYLAFLNILVKCDFLEKMTLGPCRIILGIF